MPETFAIDFETFYDSKTHYSLTTLPPYAYCHDDRFDAYLVSIVGEGFEFVGHPSRAPWTKLAGACLIAHNAAFDGMVLHTLIEKGIAPAIQFTMEDSADMAAYLLVPRNLAGACDQLLGIKPDKQMREDMDGRNYTDLAPDDTIRMQEYALNDSRLCYRIWKEFSPQYPECERRFSRLNREANWRGIRIDTKLLREGIQKLGEVVWQAEKELPWACAGEKAGSVKQFQEHARNLGIPDVPRSIKKDDPAFVAWANQWKDKYPFIQARLTHAGTTPHLARLRNLDDLLQGGELLRPSRKYFGTHTGRATSDRESQTASKFNILNMPKKPVHGIDVRNMLIPREGHQFAVYDYAQIEARLVQWMAGNTLMVDLLNKEGNLYQATAKVLGWFPMDAKDLSKTDKTLYARSKVTALGLGYGMGAAKFFATCTLYGMDVTAPWCQDTVRQWRLANREVVNYWYMLDRAARQAAETDHTLEITLPSGRTKTYFNVQLKFPEQLGVQTSLPQSELKQDLWASVTKGGRLMRTWGGSLTENLVQATARDILRDGILAVVDAKPHWQYITDVYDEVIFEVPKEEAAEAEVVIPKMLCITGETWAKGCPIAVEGKIIDFYQKI